MIKNGCKAYNQVLPLGIFFLWRWKVKIVVMMSGRQQVSSVSARLVLAVYKSYPLSHECFIGLLNMPQHTSFSLLMWEMIYKVNSFTYISWPNSLVPHIVCWEHEGAQTFYFYLDLKPFWLGGNDIMVLRNKVWGWEEIEETQRDVDISFFSDLLTARPITSHWFHGQTAYFLMWVHRQKKIEGLGEIEKIEGIPLVNLGFLPICKLIFFTSYQIQYG